jgi:hypothetical protein
MLDYFWLLQLCKLGLIAGLERLAIRGFSAFIIRSPAISAISALRNVMSVIVQPSGKSVPAVFGSFFFFIHQPAHLSARCG